LVEFIQENFRGHDENLCVGVEFDVAGNEAERDVWIFLAEFVKLLVAEAFNGHGVNDFFALTYEIFKREFACKSFATAGVSGHENVVALHDALDGVFLENTQTVWVFFKVV